MKFFLVFFVFLLSASSTFAANDNHFSCPSTKQGACLNQDDNVCGSDTKCTSEENVCFDAAICNDKGFICKSKFDDMAGEFNTLLSEHNDLVEQYNQHIQRHQIFQNCILSARTLAEAKSCNEL